MCVNFVTRQFRRQAHILPAFADGKRLLVFRHGDKGSPLLGIDVNLLHPGRRERVGHEFSLVIRPFQLYLFSRPRARS